MSTLTTTLKALRAASACTSGYIKLRKGLGPKYGSETPIPLTRILDINGLGDTLWALDKVVAGGDKILLLWACDCADRVLPIYEMHYPNDLRVRQCIITTRAFANGTATLEDLAAAGDAAWDAARATAGDAAGDAAWAAARAAARAARAAARAARAAARAARDAAWAAAGDAARAAWAAGAAAGADVWAAWDAAEEQWQIGRLREYLEATGDTK